ncbi:hypothetical protein ACFPER_13930 [Agromyces aurantiacus]|uniref:Glycosyl hydrolases family 39 N-terminal catalytic domain-containing protein n=1 Tax=Agromyces aurantiacus TaxID=165814 RepID=A0ABV9R9F5_9MICO|nr:hypothetical protein [Agromyces aurantiacus]MBM7505206.1 hypothetical protein [Agromyces aurantiacus]
MQTSKQEMRVLEVDASDVRAWKSHKGAAGIPGSAPGHPGFPDMTPLWRDAGVRLVRSYDWVSRLDTRDNPASLFPDWDADPADPASYNFAATDAWVEAVHSVGADVLFTFASSIPQNKLPAIDLAKYGIVVEHVVRHYAEGWADGPAKPIRMFEFGDQPDLGPLHFVGRPEEFFDMYAEFCAAVKRVDDTLIVGGPSLAFPLNADADYREGFLSFVHERELPLDFFSFLWFTDATRDPMDFRFLATELRALLDASGFPDTKLMLSYWNYLGIPANDAPAAEKAAFQAASMVYLQDTPLDYAIFFRADSGKDPHYGFVDPAGVHGRDGSPDERAVAFSLIGRAMTGERLGVSGGDQAGFAALAGRDGDVVRILVSNFEAPESALAPRASDEFVFRIPIGSERIELGLRLPPQRDALASAGVDSARIALVNLPWSGRDVSIQVQSLHGPRGGARHEHVSESGSLDLDVEIEPQSVLLVELSLQER